MRLLTYGSDGALQITRDLVNDIPPYAILSHTWGIDDEEVACHELQHESSKRKAGYGKIQFCGQQAKRDNLDHFWVDTCCIDKANHVEPSEAITSMYRWYHNAQMRYVYLADVSSPSRSDNREVVDSASGFSWKEAFCKSRWFTRGWTLQELIAPQKVVFFSNMPGPLFSSSCDLLSIASVRQ